MNHMRWVLLSVIAGLAVACGSSQNVAGATPPGQSHGAGSSAPNDVDDLDAPSDLDKSSSPDTKDGANQGDGTSAPGTGPAVTFRVKNSADEDLVFSLDKGWQPVIFAYSGEPPNAKPILMFPKACTAQCSAKAGERCPVCTQPDKVKDIKAAEKREIVAPQKTLDVPWDGQIHIYEKTRAGGRKCECYRKQAVPPETYTVRACGLRITKSATRSTKYQCVQGSMHFPADGPQVIELDFPSP